MLSFGRGRRKDDRGTLPPYWLTKFRKEFQSQSCCYTTNTEGMDNMWSHFGGRIQQHGVSQRHCGPLRRGRGGGSGGPRPKDLQAQEDLLRLQPQDIRLLIQPPPAARGRVGYSLLDHLPCRSENLKNPTHTLLFSVSRWKFRKCAKFDPKMSHNCATFLKRCATFSTKCAMFFWVLLQFY